MLYVYMLASRMTVNSVLIREEGGVQALVYHTNKTFRGAEERYPRIEKIAFALVVMVRRLRPYFQAHTIRVLINQPLRAILHKPETSGRLVKWSVELSKFNIEYYPRGAIKG